MPVSTHTTTTEVWRCDRCGKRGGFPDWANATALEGGWIRFDLGRSLKPNPVVQTEKNVQVLCPECVEDLRLWFNVSSSR